MSLYGPTVLRYVRRYATDSDEVAELNQRVWVQAFYHRMEFRGEGSPRGWLLAIARTVCGRFARRKRPVRIGDAVYDLPDTNRRPDERIAIRQAAVITSGMLMELPPRQRRVVELRLVEGLGTSAAAEILGCREGTIKSTLHAALKRLRRDPRADLVRRLMR